LVDMRGGGSGRLATEGSGRGEVEEPYERGSWEEVDGGVRAEEARTHAPGDKVAAEDAAGKSVGGEVGRARSGSGGGRILEERRRRPFWDVCLVQERG
jgi:hypothetical protein